MKGVIIDEDNDPKEERDVGIGVECPECGTDMKKTIHLTVKADYEQDKGMKTTSTPSAVKWSCPVCKYCEEVV